MIYERWWRVQKLRMFLESFAPPPANLYKRPICSDFEDFCKLSTLYSHKYKSYCHNVKIVLLK